MDNNKIKSCETFKYSLSDFCMSFVLYRKGCLNFARWEPKNKPTENKIIFTDDQFEEFYDYNKNMFCYDKKRVKEIMDCNGYIKKSLVEEAEEIWKEKCFNGLTDLENKQHEAIQSLKLENKRLKSE